MKKILGAAFAVALTFALGAPVASACPDMGDSTVADKDKSKEDGPKTADKSKDKANKKKDNKKKAEKKKEKPA